MQAILHNIRSIHNVGSIFRTADGLGVEKLYLTGYTPEPVDRFGRKRDKFAKVALGAEETVSWESKKDIFSLIDELQANNISVLACEPTDSAVPVSKKEFENKDTCLVFGNEVDGLSHDLIKQCNATVKIPMQGDKTSLNVAVAFGTLTYSIIDKMNKM